MSSSRYSISRLATLSLPAIAASVLEPIAGMVDTAMLGQIDTRFVEALGLTVAVLSAFTWIFNFLVSGVTSHVGQAVGRGDRAEIGTRIKMALLVAAGAGFVTGAALIGLQRLLLGTVLGASDELVDLATSYYVLRAVGLPLVLLVTAITGVLRGLQRIGVAFVLGAIVTATNAAVTYVLLFVFELGLLGAAVGTVGAFALGVVLGLAYLARQSRELGLIAKPRFGRALVASFGRDALHIVGRTAALLGSFFVAAAVATRLGDHRLAAHHVAMQLWLFSSFLIDGFAITGTMLGARFIGEGRRDLYQALGRRLLVLGALAGGAFAAVYLGARELIQRVFTDDPSLSAQLDLVWPLLALTQPMNGLVYVYDGLLFASGSFSYLRRHMWIGVALLFLPLVLLASTLPGVWWALVALNTYRCVSCAWCFHRGQHLATGSPAAS